ncbi:MAG TPA: EamA family transporter, partial [Alphaproteobacteria bacterium]
NIEMKRTHTLPLMTFMALTTLFSVPFLTAASLFYHEPVMTSLKTANLYQAGFAMIYQIFLGGTAFMMWKHLMTKYDVGKLVPLTLLQPLFGIVAGMLIFSEILTGKLILGGLLIVAGVALITFNRKIKPETD